MTNKKLLMSFGILLSLVFALTLVSATTDIRYTVYSGVINDDSTITTSTNPVNGLNVAGYECANAACTLIGAQVAGLTGSTSTNQIVLSFPTQLATNGYVLYFHEEGYIGSEITGIKIWGDFPGQTFDAPNPAYLYKKASGYAPINSLDVINQIHPGFPVEVSLSVGIDADTYSAIEDSRYSNIPLDETVETLVTLEILDSDDEVVYTDSQTLNIPYSDSLPTTFVFSGFDETGDYTISLSTDVTDAKILNSGTQTVSQNIEVIEQEETQYAFTTISNLETDPFAPDTNERIDFSFDYESHYVDALMHLSDIDTRITVTLYRNGNFIERFSADDLEAGNYEFSRTFIVDGSYRILVEGEPANSDDYLDVIRSSQELTFIVGEEGEDDGSDDSHDSTNDDADLEDELAFLKKGISQKTGQAVDLTPAEGYELSILKKVIWTLAILSLLLLIAIAIVAIYQLR